MTIRITKRESPGRGMRRIALGQIDTVIAQLEDPHLGPEIKVHDCRKCCKVVRALLWLNAEAMGENRKAEDARFRDIAGLLGPLRDAHVQAGILAAMKGEPAPPPPGCEAELREALARLREARRAVAAWPLTARAVADIMPGFIQTYDRCRLTWERAGQGPSDHRFHRYRKWAKYYRYQVNVLELVDRAAMRRRGEMLERLGDVLGEAHDLAELQATLEKDGNTDVRLVATVVNRKRALYRQALWLGRKCLSRRPASVAAELAGRWANWRS